MTTYKDTDPAALDDAPTVVLSPPTRSRPSRRRSSGTAHWVGTHRKIVVAICAGVVVLAGLATYAAPRVLNPVPTVTVFTVHDQALNTFVAGGGLIYPVQERDIVYPVSAGVIKVNAQVGQEVTQGEVLLTLDNAGLQAQLTQARASVEAAQTYLNGVYNTPGVTAAVIASAQSNLQQAQALYSSLAQEINSPEYSNGNILSPFAGVVTVVNATPGTVANSGTVLVSVADLKTVIVKVEFPLDQRSFISLNEIADVYSAAAPDQQFAGAVTTINPVLTSAGADTFEAWITVDNSASLLFSGESVYARVHAQETLPTVPELAVVNPDADSVVFLYSNGRAHVQHVVVGIQDGSNFGITNGLTDGDQVILVGQYQLTDNERVKVRAIQQ